MHNAFNMKNVVALILLALGDLGTENTLHNKIGIPVGGARVDMELRTSCMVSGKHRMLNFLRITSGRILTIVTDQHGSFVGAVPNHVTEPFTTMTLDVSSTS